MSRVAEFDRFGGPEVLHIVETPTVQPAAGEVTIRIEAFAVNPLDVMMRSGTSPAPVPLPHARLGIEGTGVIDSVGSAVTGLEVGDPVIVAAIPDAAVRGSYAEYITLPATWVIARPAALEIPQAAAIWVAYSTAYGALMEVAGLRPGDRLLISGASGGVGRAAMQIAAQIGATPIAVTRNPAKTAELLAAGAATVIATETADLVDAVCRGTGGTGADVTLDLVRGPGQRDLLNATRPGGKLVAAGFLDPRPTPRPADSAITVIDYRGFDYLLDLAVVGRMAAFLDAGVRLGALLPAVGDLFAFDEIVEAHRRFEKGIRTGKVVVMI